MVQQQPDEARRMLDTFASVGATHFDLTHTGIDGEKRGFRPEQSLAQVKNSMPKLFPGAASRQNNIIVRPLSKTVHFVQLDDLDAGGLDRVGEAAFLTLETSPGNHQAWGAVSGLTTPEEAKDFARRLRKGTGADHSTSGATRVAGTTNYKRKYEPDFPTVRIGATAPGRVVTKEQLEAMGLVAAPEPEIPPRHSPPGHRREGPAMSQRHARRYGRIMPVRSPERRPAANVRASSSGSVLLFLGNGDGTFGTPTSYAVGYVPTAMATASFRANGRTHVVVANLNPDNATGTIQVLFGDGQGHLSTSSTVNIDVPPAALSVADFNGDGFPDILVTGTDGSVNLLLNDATGLFSAVNTITTSPLPTFTAVGDFNGDGLPDYVQITQDSFAPSTASSLFRVQVASIPPNDPLTISEFLNSASSQASLATTAQTLPAGTDVLTAIYAGDANFTKLASAGVSVTVTKTVPALTWAQPAPIEYGTPLSATQLDATASVPGATTYSSAAGAVLPPGTNTVTATFVPTDAFDYAGATASQAITVAAPGLSSISPSVATGGTGGATITVTGQGFINGAIVNWNGSPLATTWVNLGQLTATVPAALLTTSGKNTITVTDPGNIAVLGTATFTIVAGTAVAQASASAMATPGQNSSVTLTVDPYPVPITATLTLAFTPTAPNTVSDPTVLFPNNTTTDVIQIPANSSTPIPAIDFSSGSTAGTITFTIQLVAGGTSVTPASLVPLAVSVPAGPPVINSVALTRSGTSMSTAIMGLSPTRNMTSATFTFTAAPGKSLKTTTATVDLTASFTGWYQSAASDTFGTTFLYMQPFTLNTDASDVASISVTLTNSQGVSQSASAQ
jgi:hypothetical protein